MKAIEQYPPIYFCKVVCFLSFYLKFDTLGVCCFKSSLQSILSKCLDSFQSVVSLKLELNACKDENLVCDHLDESYSTHFS